jgi:hypothetical protein
VELELKSLQEEVDVRKPARVSQVVPSREEAVVVDVGKKETVISIRDDPRRWEGQAPTKDSCHCTKPPLRRDKPKRVEQVNKPTTFYKGREEMEIFNT